MLRNPIEEAFSHYLMDYRLGLTSNSFEEEFDKKEDSEFSTIFSVRELFSSSKKIFRYFWKRECSYNLVF